jgi:hypothetical protein
MLMVACAKDMCSWKGGDAVFFSQQVFVAHKPRSEELALATVPLEIIC